MSISFGLLTPEAAGLLMPAIAALLQAKEVPAVPLVGLYENKVLLHMAAGFNPLVSLGLGLTVTTTF